MKYGVVFREESVPQWWSYNVDYDELKHLIKRNTTRQSGQAISVPGQPDTHLEKFEREFYEELYLQHDRVGLFVKSKTDEIARRLSDHKKKTIHLVAKTNLEQRRRISARRKEKFSRLETKILECGEEISNLERFVAAQKTAFQKILKKYKKWTGSTTISTRFTEDVLGSPKSFTRRDFEPLKNQFNVILTLIRESSPPQSEVSTPLTRSRQQSRQDLRPAREVAPVQPQSYWNEYDDGSEAGDANEPYTLFIDPNDEATFPGAKTATYIFSKLSAGVKIPIEKVKRWLNMQSSPGEQRPLVAERRAELLIGQPTSVRGVETDFDDDTSSSDFPNGYDTFYATLPSVQDQRLTRHRDKLLFQVTVSSLLAAFLLLIVSAILIATGKHRLRVEVDAGVTVGVIASLLFSTLGFTTMMYCFARVGWFQRCAVTLSYLIICAVSGILLVVMADTGI